MLASCPILSTFYGGERSRVMDTFAHSVEVELTDRSIPSLSSNPASSRRSVSCRHGARSRVRSHCSKCFLLSRIGLWVAGLWLVLLLISSSRMQRPSHISPRKFVTHTKIKATRLYWMNTLAKAGTPQCQHSGLRAALHDFPTATPVRGC